MKLNLSEALNSRREVMISNHLLNCGIRDQKMLRAMREVPREAFIGKDMAELAYEDHPLPIDNHSTENRAEP